MSAPIGESELIITSRGTIYHLDLAPEYLADTVITVGDPDRVAEVSKYFDRIEHIARHREFVTHTGYLGRKRITVVGTGIGPDNIDIVLNELDAAANIDFGTRMVKEQHRSLLIIRMGTCGSLQPDVPEESFVVSTHAIGLDNLMHYYDYCYTGEEQLLLDDFIRHTGLQGTAITPYIAPGAQELLPYFSGSYAQGITVTCPGFYGPQGRVLRGALGHPGLIDALPLFRSGAHRIISFEMETSAIYGLGKLLGHRCLSINTVVANRVQNVFARDLVSAVDRMICQSLQIIEGL